MSVTLHYVPCSLGEERTPNVKFLRNGEHIGIIGWLELSSEYECMGRRGILWVIARFGTISSRIRRDFVAIFVSIPPVLDAVNVELEITECEWWDVVAG